MGEDSFITRLGGDNFVGICSSDKFEEVKSFLKETKLILDSENTVNIQTRSGVFVIPEDFKVNSPSDILVKIMSAYSSARENDNENVVVFDDEIREEEGGQEYVQKEQMRKDHIGSFPFRRPHAFRNADPLIRGHSCIL